MKFKILAALLALFILGTGVAVAQNQNIKVTISANQTVRFFCENGRIRFISFFKDNEVELTCIVDTPAVFPTVTPSPTSIFPTPTITSPATPTGTPARGLKPINGISTPEAQNETILGVPSGFLLMKGSPQKYHTIFGAFCTEGRRMA